MRLTANCSAPSTQKKKDEYNNQFMINLLADRRSSDFQREDGVISGQQTHTHSVKKKKKLIAAESEIMLSNFA